MNPRKNETYLVSFDAYRVALEMIRSLRGPLSKLRGGNESLTKQLERAAASVPLNLSEGRQRTGKDQRYLYRVAAGSAAEVRACLEVAEAFGLVQPADIGASLALVDRILAMTWRLTH